MNNGEGYIYLEKALEYHWIAKNAEYAWAWVIMIMNVNWSDAKVLIGNEVIECKTGQSLSSLEEWATKFGKSWDKSKVRRFFELLKNDHMIDTENMTKTTRLSIVNFERYQDKRNASETQSETHLKRKRNASETLSTPNKYKERIINTNKIIYNIWVEENLKKIIRKYEMIYPDWIESSETLKDLLSFFIFDLRPKLKNKKLKNTGFAIRSIINRLESDSGKTIDVAIVNTEYSISKSYEMIYPKPEEIKPLTGGQDGVKKEYGRYADIVQSYLNNTEIRKTSRWKTIIFEQFYNIDKPMFLALRNNHVNELKEIDEPMEFIEFIIEKSKAGGAE